MAEMRLFSLSEVRAFEPAILQKAMVLGEARRSPQSKLVFLSHSSQDDNLVPAAIGFFMSFGASVYTDDFDKRLPNPPSVATAAALKAEIKGCPRLVVLATANSHTSRWIPWELGLGDGIRDIPPNAVLPFMADGQVAAWTKTEYFGLYPKIMNLDDTWVVTDPRSASSWPLRTWLHGQVR
jgi:hypothetical protein